MSVRSVARFPEVRKDGSLWVPLVPPPAPRYRQLSPNESGAIGMRAALSYTSEWILDLRVFTDPYEERTDKTRWVVQLCNEGAWHEFLRHGTMPVPRERVIASVQLVFLLDSV